jgi:hypothetical protein
MFAYTGLLTIIMLRIPPSLANAGKIIFSLQPHPTFEFGNNQPGNSLSYNSYGMYIIYI